jgi:signal recognition particle GTPase
MFENLNERLESAFKQLKGEGRINEINIASTVKEIRNHPWMQTPCDMKQVRENILADLAEKETANTAASSREDVASRGDNMLDLIR